MGRRRQEWVRRPPGSKTYHYDFSIEGARFRGSCETNNKRDAESFARRLREEKWREMKLGAASEPAPPPPMTLNNAAARYWLEVVVPRYLTATEGEPQHRVKARLGRASTTKWHIDTLLRIIGPDTLLRDVDTGAASDMVLECQRITTRHGRPMKGSTIKNHIVILADILARARKVWREDAHEIDTREIRRMIRDEPKRDTFLTKAEANRLIDLMLPHTRPIVEFAIYTSLRFEAFMNLRWEEIDLDARKVTLRVKGNKIHSVALIEPAVRLLATYEPDPARRQGPVWRFGMATCGCKKCRSIDGRDRMPIKTIVTQFRAARAAIGRPKLRIHDLRHTSASWIVEGKDKGMLYHAQQHLGHSNASTTTRYAHLTEGDMRSILTEALSFRDAAGPQAAKESA